MKLKHTYQHFGESGILINWPRKINPSINDEVLLMDSLIAKNFGDRIIELVPAYHSLAVYLKEGENRTNFIELLKNMDRSGAGSASKIDNVVSIPVCYESDFAPDLEDVASKNNLTKKDVVALHTQGLYKVYFLGFLPGFPYLGGLDKQLFTPRKSTPRKFVEKGSVAIGGEQTGIYTQDSPGGWNIIGRSPLNFFSCDSALHCLLKPGDYVRFISVSVKKFKKIENDLENEKHKRRKEDRHD